eukprot:g54374.t1
MSQHRTIALSADKLVRTCFCHLGWCRDRFHLVPLLASASVPRRLSRAGTSFTLHYNNVFECYALRGTFIKCKNAKSEGGRVFYFKSSKNSNQECQLLESVELFVSKKHPKFLVDKNAIKDMKS